MEQDALPVKTELQPYDGTSLVIQDHRQSCDEDITDASCSDSGRSSVTVEIEDFTNSALMQFWHDQSCQSFTQLEGRPNLINIIMVLSYSATINDAPLVILKTNNLCGRSCIFAMLNSTNQPLSMNHK